MAANPQHADNTPATRTVEADALRQSLSETLAAVSRNDERVIVEEDGVPQAAIISLREYRRFRTYAARGAERFKAFERIGAVFADEDPEESDRLAALAVQEARERLRRESAGALPI